MTLPFAAWPAGATTALIAMRLEKVHVSKLRSAATFPATATNVFEARIEEEIFQGATDPLVLMTAAGTRLGVVVANESAFGEVFHAGDRVYCALHADARATSEAQLRNPGSTLGEPLKNEPGTQEIWDGIGSC